VAIRRLWAAVCAVRLGSVAAAAQPLTEAVTPERGGEGATRIRRKSTTCDSYIRHVCGFHAWELS
jgi:hypothetical protein